MTKTEYDSKQADWIRREQEYKNEIERLKSENNMYREAENGYISDLQKIHDLEKKLKSCNDKIYHLKKLISLEV